MVSKEAKRRMERIEYGNYWKDKQKNKVQRSLKEWEDEKRDNQ